LPLALLRLPFPIPPKSLLLPVNGGCPGPRVARMIGVGGIRPSRGLSGKTDGFRTHGDRDFGSCGVLGRELVKQRHDLPDQVAHRVVARSRRGFANDALLKRIVFKIVRIRSSRPPDARRRWLEQHMIDAYVVFSRAVWNPWWICIIFAMTSDLYVVVAVQLFARRSEGSKYFERRI
jgi:hypothetical protein